MITAHLPVLFGVGVLAGVVSTVVSLASVVSYPALLALGLPALSANVTNTVALVFTALGAAAGSQRELTGQRSRVLRLGLLTALGGATGAVLLLVTPSGTFELIAPWLIAGASLILLLQPRARRLAERSTGEGSRLLRVALFTVAVYTGYFGAAGGILTLAVLSAMIDLPLVRINAVKNVLAGLANGVAAVGFALFGPVRWDAVLPLAVGFLVGGWIGPAFVRRLPGEALRVIVAVCGVAVAVKLGIDSYG
ncbi:sulfite exporter TauE/SafE family protein [Actinoallomurus soli]|uniref:sulfite exporter TauE/SafE family protein n=1 Tax=Actinoallomurus soli TaxID=2952535 RepID=UPI00209306A9|nr:sulfite exporter TauE/SafE family protein [Actinoallomurus soli]MCO5970255.1 sulfite exporter TauE/SafE family protein [Actinoallomurus soli]